ncbi:MAG TPA: DUF3459 domain-containing protein, partial [Candidatus Brachybacterium merdigallinarum]|nr:DUF3459 domain-containing protein [Candidatus Brachybacterium merdigallinarum]
GGAYLYQGEELGLPEVRDIPDELREDPSHHRAGVPGRDGCRVPIPWQQDAPAYGFSPTGQSWLPQPPEFGPLAADAQQGVAGSTLELYRSALALRRELGLGRQEDPVEFPLDVPEGVLAVRRGAVTVLVNTTDAEVSLPQDSPLASAELLISSNPETTEPGTIPADATVWLRSTRA